MENAAAPQLKNGFVTVVPSANQDTPAPALENATSAPHSENRVHQRRRVCGSCRKRKLLSKYETKDETNFQ